MCVCLVIFLILFLFFCLLLFVWLLPKEKEKHMELDGWRGEGNQGGKEERELIRIYCLTFQLKKTKFKSQVCFGIPGQAIKHELL